MQYLDFGSGTVDGFGGFGRRGRGFFELMKYIFARKLNDQIRDGVYRECVPAKWNECEKLTLICHHLMLRPERMSKTAV